MKDELATIYENKVLISESEKVKGAVPAPGKGFEGEEKVKKMQPKTGIDSKGTESVKKPVEAEKKFNPGREKVTEDKEIENMLPTSAFDMLYSKTLVQEDDESPVEKTGAEEFDDEAGDFPPADDAGGEPTEDEEVDVATELRMIIDRLIEIAEKLGAYEGEEAPGSDGTSEGEEPIVEPTEQDGLAVPESHVMNITKPLSDSASKMQSKGNMKVSSHVSQPDTGKASTGGPGKGEADGKVKPQAKSKFGPNMSQKADASSVLSKPGSSLFGSK